MPGSPGAAAVSSAGNRSAPSPSLMPFSMWRSAPAQNPRPAPVSMIATTRGSASAAASACFTSAPMRSVQALSCFGRFSVMSAAGSMISYKICWYI